VTTSRPRPDELLFASLLLTGLVTVGLPPLSGLGLRLPLWLWLAGGSLAGTALFCALAGARARPPSGAAMRALAGRRGALLAGRAAVEEVAWRGFLLGGLAAPLGWAAALGVTSAAFALAHGNAHGRLRLVHVLTGGVFGGLYLAGGRLASAVAAHIVYNGLVVAASGPPPDSS
jgi:membrane protease YdiL (CAAX protease family)